VDLSDFLVCVVFVFDKELLKVYCRELKKPAGKKNMDSPNIDFLIRLKNSYQAGKKSFTCPSSKYIVSIATLVKKHGFIADFSLESLPNHSQLIKVELNYTNKTPSMSHVEIYSKPGRRIYSKSTNIPWGFQPNSLIIFSTSKGLLSQKQAQKAKLGGEIVAQIW